MTIQMVLLPVFVQVALTIVLLVWMASARTASVKSVLFMHTSCRQPSIVAANPSILLHFLTIPFIPLDVCEKTRITNG